MLVSSWLWDTQVHFSLHYYKGYNFTPKYNKILGAGTNWLGADLSGENLTSESIPWHEVALTISGAWMQANPMPWDQESLPGSEKIQEKAQK